MNSTEVREKLVELGCVLSGEFFFALKNGRVASKYINIDPLLTKPAVIQELMREIIRIDSISCDVVGGPEVGAIPLIYLAAVVLSLEWQRPIDAVFTSKSGGEFVLDRLGFKKAVKNKHVLIVEDIGTTGLSAKKSGDEIVEAGGTISAYFFIWNRDPDKVNEATMGAPVFSLIEERVDSWLPGQHPMWGKWPLVSDMGHPDNFSGYPGPRISLLKES